MTLIYDVWMSVLTENVRVDVSISYLWVIFKSRHNERRKGSEFPDKVTNLTVD